MRFEPSSDITQIVLFVLVIGALLAGSLWTLLPFLSGLIWATTIVVATWPALLQLSKGEEVEQSLRRSVMLTARRP